MTLQRMLTAAITASFLAGPSLEAEVPIARVKPGRGLVAEALYPDDGKAHPAVLVVGGSEGGNEWPKEQARLLAERGFAALAVAYFGVEGLPDVLERIPLEYFEHALTWLRLQDFVDPDRLGIVGESKGGELALLLASRRPEIKAVVAYVPSAVVFQSIADGFPKTSSWSLGGEELPFVAYGSVPDPQGIIDYYVSGLEQATNLEEALIPVERIEGPILLLSGRDDNLWPSTRLSDIGVDRIESLGQGPRVEHVAYPDAGHLISMIEEGVTHRGGTDAGNRAAQQDARRRLFEFLEAHLAAESDEASAPPG